MTPQQTKAAVAAAMVVVLIGALYGLNRTISKDNQNRGPGSDGAEAADVRQARLNLAGKGSGGGGADSRAESVKAGKNGKSGEGGAADSDLASIVDAATSQVLPIETEAETRDRQRYEEAMANQFKYRKLDPDKIKPVELGPALQKTSEKYGIPDNLMAAMMYVETGGAHRDGEHSMEAGYGVMNLRESNLVDTLGEGAAALGRSKEELLYDQGANIEAAGALLRGYYDDAIASGLSESEAWYMAVSQYSGRLDPTLASHLADETAGWLLRGFELHLSDGGGDLVIPPSPNPIFLPKDWGLVGMTPPSAGSGPQTVAGTTPPNAQGYTGAGGPAAGGAKVSP